MRISLDPWGGDYGSQISAPQAVDAEQPSAQVTGQQVEAGPWQPRTPAPEQRPNMTAVIDGVMRVDAPAVLSDEESRYVALFGSYAAGAVVIDRRVEIIEEQLDRLFIVGGQQSGQDVTVAAGTGGKMPMRYRSVSAADLTPDSLRESLMTAMRQAEVDLARKLSGNERLILADGNLTFLSDSSSVVGVIKTIQRMYLASQEAKILEQLQPGERTPLFQFSGSSKRKGFEVFTCYLRLANPRPIEHPFTGLVRLEVKLGLGIQQAVVLLDQAAHAVSALASRAPKDPRAPQNLIPIGGLERRLRHRLGDPKLVRRCIEKALLNQI